MFAFLLGFYGEEYLPAENAKYGISVDSMGYELGLRDGDHILQVGEVAFDKFNSAIVTKEIVLRSVPEIVVRRDGETVSVPVGPEWSKTLSSMDNKGVRLFAPRTPSIIADIKNGSIAEEIGLEEGDHIFTYDGKPAAFIKDIAESVSKSSGASSVLEGDSRSGYASTFASGIGRTGNGRDPGYRREIYSAQNG